MADQEQVTLLRQGIAAWNTWREEHPRVTCDLEDANLRDANLSYADLSNANLSGADLSNANLSVARLINANLSYANLSGAVLSVANLNGADLTSAFLNRAHLMGTRLMGADLSRASLYEANLSIAVLVGADLSGAGIGWTNFTKLDLRGVKGLETVDPKGPSSIDIDTLYLSKGQIPESFLRKVGVPYHFLTYLPSLMNTPFEYYTCFLSYSSKDQEFTDRLYADLQSKGVRCWNAPHDLRPGTYISQGIDEAIRMYDKLILILSQNAIESRWVQDEVEGARLKERESKSEVLFPIRIDETIMTCQDSWASTLRTRHIGDFTAWKHHESYQQALKRLLRDLQPKRPPQSHSS